MKFKFANNEILDLLNRFSYFEKISFLVLILKLQHCSIILLLNYYIEIV